MENYGTGENFKTEINNLLNQGDIEGAVNKCMSKLKPYKYLPLPFPYPFDYDDFKKHIKQKTSFDLEAGMMINTSTEATRLNEKIKILKILICNTNCRNDKTLEGLVDYLISTVIEHRDTVKKLWKVNNLIGKIQQNK